METSQIQIRRCKSMATGLWEMRRFILQPAFLRTGKPIGNFDQMRPREFVANWLLCAAMNAEEGSDRFSFTSDPTGGDGLIYDKSDDVAYRTEHCVVYAPNSKTTDTTLKIIKSINNKRKRGFDYANGKILIIFIDEKGDIWSPNNLIKKLPSPLMFHDLWIISLQKAVLGNYIYAVTQMDLATGVAPIWKVKIYKGFRRWKVKRMQ